ncbi:MAG: MFS transporter [Nitrospirota bacterium]|nr:MFS transporter [Nitrospirota bacterium]
MATAAETVKTNGWLILAAVYLTNLDFVLLFQSIPPIFELIRAEISVGSSELGLLMGAFALPGIFISIPGGILMDKLGPVKTGSACAILMLMGNTITAVSGGFPMMVVGRIISGVGSMALAVLAPQILANNFRAETIGRALGVLNTSVPIGTILSLNIMGYVGHAAGWRGSLWLCNVLTIAIFIFFIVVINSENAGLVQERRQNEERSKFGCKIWLLGLSWLLFNAACISFIAFSKGYFLSLNKSEHAADFMASSIMIGSVFLPPIVGIAIDRLKFKSPFVIIGGVVMSVVFFYFNDFQTIELSIGILTCAAGVVPAAIFTLVPDSMPAERLGLGFGILSTCLNIGNAFGPSVTGVAIDIMGHGVGFSFMSLYSLLFVFPILIFPLRTFREKRDVRQVAPNV